MNGLVTLYSLHTGDVLARLRALPSKSVHVIVTSPPYYQVRIYDGVGPTQFSDGPAILGMEETPERFVAHMVEIAREMKRVLRSDGSLWLNFGHTYMGGTCTNAPGWKDKCLIPIPWMVALALRADGWWIRMDNIWSKRTFKPSSATDRTAVCHEYITVLTPAAQYYFDMDAVRKPYAEASIARRKYPDNTGDVGTRHGKHQPGARAAGAKDLRGGLARRRAKGEVDAPPAGADRRMYPPNPQGRMLRTIENYQVDPALIRGVPGGPNVMHMPGAQFPDEHTATFPEELCYDPIRAGSSDAGCCADCGAPLERVVQAGEPLLDVQRASGGDAKGKYKGRARKNYDEQLAENPGDVKSRTLESMREKITVGWIPTCDHVTEDRGQIAAAPAHKGVAIEPMLGKGIVPCVVLDPFSGTATTGVAAFKLGRSYIGIDASETYNAIGVKRLEEAGGMFARRAG